MSLLFILVVLLCIHLGIVLEASEVGEAVCLLKFWVSTLISETLYVSSSLHTFILETWVPVHRISMRSKQGIVCEKHVNTLYTVRVTRVSVAQFHNPSLK